MCRRPGLTVAGLRGLNCIPSWATGDSRHARREVLKGAMGLAAGEYVVYMNSFRPPRVYGNLRLTS